MCLPPNVRFSNSDATTHAAAALANNQALLNALHQQQQFHQLQAQQQQQQKSFVSPFFNHAAFLPTIPVSALGVPSSSAPISDEINAAIAAFEASAKQRASQLQQQSSSVKAEASTVQTDSSASVDLVKPTSAKAKRPIPSGGIEKTRPTNGKKKGTRSKVAKACVFCARSHMTCDNGRPCQRCLKRRIGHMCRDSQKPAIEKKAEQQTEEVEAVQSNEEQIAHGNSLPFDGLDALLPTSTTLDDAFLDFALPMDIKAEPSMTHPLTPPSSEKSSTPVANESLDFLDAQLMSSPMDLSLTPADDEKSSSLLNDELSLLSQFIDSSILFNTLDMDAATSSEANAIVVNTPPIEKYVTDAADPEEWSLAADSLNKIIVSKYENGLLTPFSYTDAYNAVLARAETTLSPALFQRLSDAIESQSNAIELSSKLIVDNQDAVVEALLMEEAVHRLICDYDGIFGNSGMPAALWRKTGDIIKANREFAALVNLPVERLAGGEFNITQFMSDVSGVVYWEKLGGIIADPQRKAVLTTCALVAPVDGYQLQCCFSFTVRRDAEGQPLAIAGNFCPVGNITEL